MKKAIIYMLISAVLFTALNGCIRYVDHFGTMQLVFFRALGSVICGMIMIYRLNLSIVGNRPSLLLLRSIVGLTSMAIFYKTLQLMPMASAVSLRYLSPIAAAILAIIFLGEKVRKLQWVFFVAAFIGVALLKGFDTRISTTALGWSMMTAVFSGGVYVIIRKIGKTEHPVIVVNYFMCTCFLIGGLWSIFHWVMPQGLEWLIVSMMGIFGFFAQLYMTKALQNAEANLITPFKYAEAIFTIIAGWMIFGESQSWIAILAMLIIILSLIGNVWVKKGLS